MRSRLVGTRLRDTRFFRTGAACSPYACTRPALERPIIFSTIDKIIASERDGRPPVNDGQPRVSLFYELTSSKYGYLSNAEGRRILSIWLIRCSTMRLVSRWKIEKRDKEVDVTHLMSANWRLFNYRWETQGTIYHICMYVIPYWLRYPRYPYPISSRGSRLDDGLDGWQDWMIHATSIRSVDPRRRFRFMLEDTWDGRVRRRVLSDQMKTASERMVMARTLRAKELSPLANIVSFVRQKT